jgi:hypothetical protein
MMQCDRCSEDLRLGEEYFTPDGDCFCIDCYGDWWIEQDMKWDGEWDSYEE